MAYEIELTHRAAREFAKLPADVRRRMTPKIEALAADPRPRGSQLLEGFKDVRRIRVGDYRVLYRIHDDVLLVLVVRIGNRRDIYRRLR